MSEIEQYTQPAAPALRAVPEPISAMPAAAHALVEWAASADAAYALANRLTGTAFCPQQYRGKPADAAAAMLAGAEVGLSPMAALRAFDVIQGAAAPRALTLRAIAQSQGHEVVLVSSSTQEVVMRGRRRGSKEWQEVRWTIARAQQLGLTSKQQWKAQPQTMLIARATSELTRLVAADAVLGIGYSVEELVDAEPAPTTPAQRASAARRTAQRAPAVRPQAEEPDLDDAPAVEPTAQDEAPAPETATRAQVQRLNIHLKAQVGDDRDAKLAWLTEAVGRPIGSSNELTKAEAHRLINDLDRVEPDQDDEPVTGDELSADEVADRWNS